MRWGANALGARETSRWKNATSVPDVSTPTLRPEDVAQRRSAPTTMPIRWSSPRRVCAARMDAGASAMRGGTRVADARQPR